jgi:hypothetical protein
MRINANVLMVCLSPGALHFQFLIPQIAQNEFYQILELLVTSLSAYN